MARGSPVLCFVGLLVSWLSVVAAAKQKKVYIVRMKQDLMPSSYSTQSEWYAESLQSLTSTDDSMVYAYDAAFKGFAAALHPDQADALSQSDSVLGVYEDKLYSLQTTRSGHFMGLDAAFYSTAPDQGAAKDLNAASQDVIIGVLDTGVWPESKSFDDTGMRPIPSEWRGECEISDDFPPKSCNKKLIGARSFSSGVQVLSQAAENATFSPRDTNGHGSHTASTAAGAPVVGANLFGFANGTAQGMAPQARLAAYKVCWASGCAGSDILAAMEKAIADGVHVLSLSLGGSNDVFYNDVVAIGAFAAIEKGIFVSASAGNNGPKSMSLSNVAPWITTVGAGTVDRNFPAYIDLGNGVRFNGVSLYSGKGMGKKPAEVVYAKGPRSTSNLCLPGTLNPLTAKGKVVVCDRGFNSRVEKGAVVRDVGGVGMILANTPDDGGEELVADSHLVPAVTVGAKDGAKIRAYARSGNATALLSFGGTVLNVKPAPVVAAFSSRGPNTLTPEILKPDLIGPGVNILAAWSGAAPPSSLEIDTRRTLFNIISGTSMSCPHISGLAALMKAAHPEWSPSAIKSALMTTAYTVDNSRAPLRDEAQGLKSNPWAHGSGYVDPPKALSPGLVYDVETEEYVSFICSLGYTPAQVSSIVKRQVSCATKFSDPGQLNYPSFSVNFNASREVVRYSRVLKNVGTTRSGYRVVVNAPPTVTVRVRPSTLIFRHLGEKKTYRVTFSSNKGLNNQTSDDVADAFGSIAWVNNEHVVTSPVAFAWTA